MGRDPLERTLSVKSKWYLDKERKLELMHFCRQYKSWHKSALNYTYGRPSVERIQVSDKSDPTWEDALAHNIIIAKIATVDNAIKMTAPNLRKQILLCAVEGKSYDAINADELVPVGRDLFYDKMREFYWHLDKIRD